MTALKDSAGPLHIGQIVRRLREASGLTRQQMGEVVGLADTIIKSIELGHHALTGELVCRLLTAPCMADLPEMAKSAGLDLGVRISARALGR